MPNATLPSSFSTLFYPCAALRCSGHKNHPALTLVRAPRQQPSSSRAESQQGRAISQSGVLRAICWGCHVGCEDAKQFVKRCPVRPNAPRKDWP